MNERQGRRIGQTYREDLLYFLNNRWFMAAAVLTAFLCYGSSAANIVVGRDSLEGDRYIGEGNVMLATGRFGMTLWARLLAYDEAGPAYQFCIGVLAAGMLVLAGVHMCMIFRQVCGQRLSLFGCGVFTCLLISYPLMNEIWNYTGANACVSGGYLLDAAAVYLVFLGVGRDGYSRRERVLALGTAAVLLMVVCSSYESLAVVYVFLVFAVLSMQALEERDMTLGVMVRRGLVYAGVLAGGIGLRFVVQFLIANVFGVQADYANGATGILWGLEPFPVMLENLVKQCILYYGMRGCFYMPIGELVAAAGVFFVLTIWLAGKYRRPLLLLPAAGMYFCLILLSVLQGMRAPYRTCQVFAVMVAITGLGAYEAVRRLGKRGLLTAIARVLLILLCLNQATYLSHLLVLDHIRSEEDGFIIRTIGTDLERGYDLSKPVIFTGTHTLSQGLLEEVTAQTSDSWLYYRFQLKTFWETETTIRFVETNVNSVLDWAMVAFNEYGEYGVSMEKVFRYYGFDISLSSNPQDNQQAREYAQNNQLPAYPEDGYIVEMEDYILVNLQ